MLCEEETRAMFEVQVNDCLLHGDAPRLVSLLRYEGLSSFTLTRLDQLVTTNLCGSGPSTVLVVLKSLGIVSENRADLQMLISNGLTAKVVAWFEAVRDLLTSDLHRGSAPLLSLSEEFFDYFLILGQASLPVSQLSVVLLQLAQFTLQTNIYFSLRLEAIRTFNSILESLSRDQRRLIQNNQNQIQILYQVAAAVLTVGDYELQVSLSEALCRLTPRRDRKQRANQWFSSHDISNAFCDIRDADFEDCRRFLNFVNRYHGDHKRVYTFPCMRAFLNSTQLFRPQDDKLDEFWVDFNVGSECVSFFIDDPQGFLWGSVHILKEEVAHYSLQLKHDEVVFTVRLNNPVIHHNHRGQTVQLSFTCEQYKELEEAVGRVFKKVQSSTHPADTDGTVQASTSTAQRSIRFYSRKKPPSKNQLKILPLSSPSSEEDSCLSEPAARNRAEILFDQIRTSTPTYNYSHLSEGVQPVLGVLKGVEPQVSEEETVETGGGTGSASKQEVQMKRKASDSGYLSDQTRSEPPQKRKMEESTSALTKHSPEGAGPIPVEGLFTEEVWSVKKVQPMTEQGADPESHLTSDITASLKAFKGQLEEHFTSCWKEVEAEVLLSVKKMLATRLLTVSQLSINTGCFCCSSLKTASLIS
ncbi:synaptonemal complex protein 2-like isoform X2 [Melanotaenia boesemani]|uniref:synaptonemal complex protein 2-like isoform X2 n=1 Tax=Melanotaenia boesemani TaxID=1250792 RepID=UPI001C0448C6|nr:synaptonemal complex protein 2-like isoform X2 [Melanotaenia boesemani]